MIEYNQNENTENIVNEIRAAYEVTMESENVMDVIDQDFDIDDFYKRHQDGIESTNKRIHQNKQHAPEGYYTLKEFDDLFKQKLSEAYASL